MSVQAEDSRSCSFLNSLGYNGRLVIWTVVCLTATKFKPLVLCYQTSQSQSHITTDDQLVSASWFRAPSGAHDQMLITVWHLLFCLYQAPPLAGVLVIPRIAWDRTPKKTVVWWPSQTELYEPLKALVRNYMLLEQLIVLELWLHIVTSGRISL
jgi:hypothetical protein